MSLQKIESLFKGYPIVEDTDGDGYPDHVALRVLVHPDMEDPLVWSGLLNLTARLAFEVVALRLPLLRKGIRSTGKGLHLIVYPPGLQAPRLQGKTLRGACWYRAGNVVCLCGTSGEAMMNRLNALATGLDTAARPRKATGIRKTSSGKRNLPFDLLDLTRLYDVSATDPKARGLNALFSLPDEKLRCPVGLALSGLVARLALEATEITLPLASRGMAETVR